MTAAYDKLPRDELYQLYIVEKMTTRQMADHYGTNKSTVIDWLHSCDIPRRPSHSSANYRGKLTLTSSELYQLVYIQGLRYREIAQMFDCDESLVGYWLDKHGIPRPGNGMARHNIVAQTVTKEELLDLYENRGYSTYYIAEIYKTSPDNIQSICKRLGIEVRPDGWNYARLRCLDDHEVRSTYELRVDDWLYEHHIDHIYEPRLPFNRRMMADFYANGWYIEIWGVVGSKRYKARQQRKIEMYRCHNAPLIEIPVHAFNSQHNGQWERAISKCLQPTFSSMLL